MDIAMARRAEDAKLFKVLQHTSTPHINRQITYATPFDSLVCQVKQRVAAPVRGQVVIFAQFRLLPSHTEAMLAGLTATLVAMHFLLEDDPNIATAQVLLPHLVVDVLDASRPFGHRIQVTHITRLVSGHGQHTPTNVHVERVPILFRGVRECCIALGVVPYGRQSIAVVRVAEQTPSGIQAAELGCGVSPGIATALYIRFVCSDDTTRCSHWADGRILWTKIIGTCTPSRGIEFVLVAGVAGDSFGVVVLQRVEASVVGFLGVCAEVRVLMVQDVPTRIRLDATSLQHPSVDQMDVASGLRLGAVKYATGLILAAAQVFEVFVQVTGLVIAHACLALTLLRGHGVVGAILDVFVEKPKEAGVVVATSFCGDEIN